MLKLTNLKGTHCIILYHSHLLNIFFEKHSEILSFVCVYAGQSIPKDQEQKVQYSDLCVGIEKKR